MGINYYVVRKATEEQKEKVISLIKDNNFEIAKDELNELIKDTTIHLGKSSYGWKFVFNHNNKKYYELNTKSITSFLNQDGIRIEDEYGKEIYLADFWKMVKEKENGLDNEQYYKKCCIEPFTVNDTKFEEYSPSYNQFYSDGLLFELSEEFC